MNYREPAKTDGVALVPVVIDPPLTIDPFWVVTDGTVWLNSRQDCTLESEMCARFASYDLARAALQRAGKIAQGQLHILRVTLTTAVVDETYSRATANATED